MNFSIRAVLVSGFAALMVVIAGTSLFTAYETSKIDHELEDIMSSRMPLALAMGNVVKETNASAVALQGWVITRNPTFRNARAQAWVEIDKNLAEVDRLVGKLAPSGQTAIAWKGIRPEFDQLRQAQARLEAFVGSPEQAANLLVTDVAPHQAKISEVLDGKAGASGQREAGLDERQVEVLVAEGRDALERSDLLLLGTWIALAVGLLLGGVISFAVIRRVVPPLVRLTGAMEATVKGDYHSVVDGTERGDEIGTMARALKGLKDMTVVAVRGKVALDRVERNVMVADTNLDVVYANDAVLGMLRKAENDIRKDLPNFSADKLIGTNIDKFHKNPAHQRGVIPAMTGTVKSRLTIGGRTFDLVLNPVIDQFGQRLGTVVEWGDMTEQLAAEAALKQLQAEATRASVALTKVERNVMIADPNLDVVFANDAVLSMLRKAEADIRKDIPAFSADTLIGSNIDKFHKNPAHQRGVIPAMTGTVKSRLKIGGRTFDLVLNPVVDKAGQRLGTVVEWSDVTQQLAIEQEIQDIVTGAVAGDFSRRLDMAGKADFMARLSEGMNSLLTTVAKALDEVKDVVGSLAQGKLSARMSTEYSGVLAELSTDINAMGERLLGTIRDISEGSRNIAASSAEISQATDDLAARTEQQAANLEETAAAMEEMTATVQKNAENALQANGLVEEAKSRATAGGEVVDKAVSAVDSIQKSSGEMAEIVNLIDDIAFQTNLLALNAAVEAARAGDAGKGFAVVATEVRSLAQRSGEAAKNIKDLIKTSNNHVSAGVSLVNETGKALKGIIESVTQIATIIQDVSGASREQATGLGEVNSAVSQMDEMTQQNAAMVEETQAAAKSLADIASQLSEQVAFFDIGGAGARAAAPARVAAPTAAPARPKAAAPVVRPKAPAPAAARPKAPAVSTSVKVLPKPAPQKPAPAATAGDDDWKEF